MTEDLAVAKRALQRLAADHEVTEGGHRKKISRLSMINIAREACHALGIDYGLASLKERDTQPVAGPVMGGDDAVR